MDGNRNPELQRVLAALNSFSQQPQQSQQHSSYITPHTNTYEAQNIPYSIHSNAATYASIPGLGLLPPTNTYDRPITPPSLNRNQLQRPNQLSHQNIMSTQRPSTEPLRSKTSTPKYDTPDASNITTWPAALKHITRHLASNEKVAARVKHLIKEQHKHEREWWAGRVAIVDRQQGRPGSSEQVSAILKSLGADVPAATKEISLPDAEQKKANEAELKAYDEKVYKALCAMASDFDRQLREMGVPFYSIRGCV